LDLIMATIFHPLHGWIDKYEPTKRPTPPGWRPMGPGERPPGWGRPKLWADQAPASRSFWALDHKPTRLCQGCERRQSRPGRTLCLRCKQRKGQYGHPEATRHVKVRKLFGAVIAQALRTIEYIQKLPNGHPSKTAIDHALSTLRTRLAIAWKYRETPWRPWQPPDLTINRRLAQLARHEVPAEQILATVGGFIWARHVLPSVIHDQNHFHHQLGRYVLTLIPVPHPWRQQANGQRIPEPLGSTACRTFGAWLIDKVGVVAHSMATDHGLELPPKVADKPITKTLLTRALRRPRWRPLGED
jgi:hypothetical protein